MRTYIKKYVVMDEELEIRSLRKGAISTILLEKGHRLDLDKVSHRFTDHGGLILTFDGVEHPLSRDSYHLNVLTDTIDV